VKLKGEGLGMKKVLFMLSSMNIGGVEKSLLSLLSVIPKEKYDITLLLLEKKGGFMELLPEGVKVEEASWYQNLKPLIMQPPQKTLKNYLINKQFSKIISFVLSYIFSEKLFKNRYIFYNNVFKNIPSHEKEFDIAISYQGPTDIIDYYIANRVCAQKKISWVHFDVSKHNINVRFFEKIYRKFDKIFIVSEGAKKRLIEQIPTVVEKTEVFRNIISKKLINELSKKHKDFDENYKGIKIVTVGRLSREKGQDIAIKVLSRFLKNGYEIKWYCIGEGNQRREYENLIKEYGVEDNFILMGSTSNPYPFIAKTDIYVQTSRHEGYCLTLAEAKCLHKPIITTDFIGAFEQITDNFNGLIVGANEEELYEKIKFLIENPKQRDKLKVKLSQTELDTTFEIEKFINYV
jgi:glycosyltransferase involved in cell wall biosynthesis